MSTKYAIDWVRGSTLQTLVIPARDALEASAIARSNLRDAGFRSASLGTPRPATQSDVDAADRDARECSMCRGRHGYEIVHACE